MQCKIKRMSQYLNDPREDVFRYEDGLGCYLEENNREEKMYKGGSKILDLCDLPIGEYMKPMTVITNGGGGDLQGKADKVNNAINGNFAGLDSEGNLTDSGSKASDFATQSDLTDALADYVQKSQTVGLLKNDGTVDTNTYLTQQDIADKADKTLIVTVSESSLIQELSDNTIYQCSDLSSLTISIPSSITSSYISQINFASGSETATTFTAPNTIIWYGDDLINNVFVPALGKQYVVIFYYDGANIRSIVQSN